jgi:ArsR family transcriptional regulator
MPKTAMRRNSHPTPSGTSLVLLAEPLRLLADPTRLRILECLMGGLQCNCTIRESLGLPMNLISHHLKLLKEAGLVRAERDPSDARWIYYEIDPQALASLCEALSAALAPSRLRPRADHCGPPACCPPSKPRKVTSMRRVR